MSMRLARSGFASTSPRVLSMSLHQHFVTVACAGRPYISLLRLANPLIRRDIEAFAERNEAVPGTLQLADSSGQDHARGAGILLVLQHNVRSWVGSRDLRVHGIAGVQRSAGAGSRDVVPVDCSAKIARSKHLQIVIIVVAVRRPEECRAGGNQISRVSPEAREEAKRTYRMPSIFSRASFTHSTWSSKSARSSWLLWSWPHPSAREHSSAMPVL